MPSLIVAQLDPVALGVSYVDRRRRAPCAGTLAGRVADYLYAHLGQLLGQALHVCRGDGKAITGISQMALVFLQTHHTAMAQQYDRLLVLSIAIQNAPFSLIVSFSHSEPSTKRLKRLIQTNLTLQVAHLARAASI